MPIENAVTYDLEPKPPVLDAAEFEDEALLVAEVRILWGEQVLYTSHLAPGASFCIGEQAMRSSVRPAPDFIMPQEKIGIGYWPLVVSAGGEFIVHIPAFSTGTIRAPESALGAQEATCLEQVRPRLPASSELAGAVQAVLGEHHTVRMAVADFVFEVRCVRAGKAPPRSLAQVLDFAVLPYFAASFATVGSLLCAMAFFMPPMGVTDGESTAADELVLMQNYLRAAAEREKREEPVTSTADDSSPEGGQGAAAQDESGAMGKAKSNEKNRRYSIKGPAENVDKHLSRSQALNEAATFGIIGLVMGSADAPTAPWGRASALGDAEFSFNGNMWGDSIGEAGGTGGLGLLGTSQGGGSRYDGVGFEGIGTLDHGAGGGLKGGFGSGHGRLRGGHRVKALKVRMALPRVSGRLPKEVIQRVVRQNYGRFRLCYERGLTRNPNLEGRVNVRFVIGRSGAVSNVANGGSSIPDSAVVNCVVRAYYGLSFPKPENGIVTVSYPIAFSPG